MTERGEDRSSLDAAHPKAPLAYAPPSPRGGSEPAAIPDARVANWLNTPATPFTQWLERYRFVFFAGITLFILIQFNGQWRIGLDSSLYRGVGESLWQGNGYRFAGREQTLAYPGLPTLLAVSHKLTGNNSIVPVLALFNVLTVLTVLMTYHLIRLRYPLWIAVVVMCGVGLNARFVQQAQEVMTDAPFVFGCVAALLGWELFGLAQTSQRKLGALALLLFGLFVAATMRPTFWVLALAWMLVLVWNAVRYRDRRSFVGLGALAAVLVAFVLIDPRVRGLNVLKGGYEQQFMQSFAVISERLLSNGPELFSVEIPEAFFSEKLWIFGLPLGLLILFGCLMVTRRQPLWGLQVFILTGVMLIMSDVPRYYLMVLPTLWLGYVLMLLWATQTLALKHRDWVLFGAFSLANLINVVLNFALFQEQHIGDFAERYHDGKYVAHAKMAELIRTRVKPEEVVIGPAGQVLSYMSGRQVLNGKLLGFETAALTKYPNLVAAAQPTYLVGPHQEYEAKDRGLHRLLDHGVIRPGKLIAQTDKMWLSFAAVHVPTTDWRKLPSVPVRPLADKPERRVMSAEERAKRELKAARERKRLRAEREERRLRNERKQRLLRRQRREQQQKLQAPTTAPAATSPATIAPTTAPSTRPAAAMPPGVTELTYAIFA